MLAGFTTSSQRRSKKIQYDVVQPDICVICDLEKLDDRAAVIGRLLNLIVEIFYLRAIVKPN